MFNFNYFAFGWFSALLVDAFMDNLPLTFIICLFGAVSSAAILWRITNVIFRRTFARVQKRG